MTQEEKELLFKDLCARLPYGVMVRVEVNDVFITPTDEVATINTISMLDYPQKFRITPYLRPMSSMTDEEAMEVAKLWGLEDILSISVKENYISVELCDGVAMSETYTIWFNEIVASIRLFDWLNSNHFDYRGLIEKGLALEAPEGMYK